MDVLKKIIDLIDTAIDDNTDNILTNGNIIASWYKSDVDEYREILEKWHEWIWKYKEELINLTGIKTLRIKYTNNSWYFIEIPKSNSKELPETFIHKQTLVSALRYTTVKLQEFQAKSDTASMHLEELEYNYFIDIRNSVKSHFSDLYKISRAIESLDFYTNSAYISLKYNYSTPEISSNYSMKIIWWKHPVMERVVDDFISNNIDLKKSEFIGVITWPNMWWKSTYLRQNALLILLAHIWFDIPAKSAIIPITDRIFSRVWSWDNLFLWQSTFMVEMQEIAYILRNSTQSSFIIIDEIGRGTSTYDWMCLAWAILKFIHDTIKAKTLFATHYHEIIDFSWELTWVWNYSVAVWENAQSIVFLRKIVPWGIKKSYGIEVAWIAWIPKAVLESAQSTLWDLHSQKYSQQLTIWNLLNSKNANLNKVDEKIEFAKKIQEKIERLDVNSMTPLEAITLLWQIQEQVKKRK